jgi:hypothetical protein
MLIIEKRIDGDKEDIKAGRFTTRPYDENKQFQDKDYDKTKMNSKRK